MNILVVLGILVVFGLLGFRRANLFVWAIAWWVGCYVFFRFGFTAPIPVSVDLDLHGHRLDRDPGIRLLEPGASRRSLPPARPTHDGEAVRPLLVATVVAIPALAAANVYGR